VEQLYTNLLANFNFLQAQTAEQPDALMGLQYFGFMSDNRERICGCLDYFNTKNSTFQVEMHVSTHEATIVSRPDSTVVAQPIYMLTWNLCVTKMARISVETSVSQVDRLFEAIGLNPGVRRGGGAMDGADG
jgi:hypothetical protein